MQAPLPNFDWRWHGAGHEHGYFETTPRSSGYGGFYDFAERNSEESTGGGCFLRDDTTLHSTSKMDPCDYDGNKSAAAAGFYAADDEDGRQDIFDMSSFFRGPDDLTKMETEEMVHLAKEYSEKLIDPTTSTTECHGEDEDHLNDDYENNEQRNESSDTVAENVMDGSDSSIDSVVMGIPYYVACQWQQMQQQQLQQQQAVMMLWWQAYLSGAYNMMGPKGTSATSQLGWSLPTAGLSAFHGAYANFGEDSFYQHMLMMDDQGHTTNIGSKRRRKSDPNSTNDPTQNQNKKGRRPRHDERVCKNCGTNETPFWRKDKQDGLPLCNACGLYLSKNDAPRPKVLWKTSETQVHPAAATAAMHSTATGTSLIV